jgi:hypothetical protein
VFGTVLLKISFFDSQGKKIKVSVLSSIRPVKHGGPEGAAVVAAPDLMLLPNFLVSSRDCEPRADLGRWPSILESLCTP